MTYLSHRTPAPSRTVRGFSLIEVMVAVVILATGLLALAALQGMLARNSTDAKARSAVMAAMTSRMAVIRRAPPTSGSTWAMSTDWVSQAAAQAGTSDLQVVEAIGAWSWNSASTGAAYVSTAVASPASTFTRVTLTATWSAADGSKSLKLSSDFSGNIYGLGKGYPGNDPLGSAARYPIVRQNNPSNTAGVIPIVTGDQATAASNPQPIIVGANNNLRVGTSFDLLNYVPEGATARITKRFQTEVIKCRCSFGAAGYSVAGKPQWPTVWNGASYSVYPGSGDPAGVVANAGENPSYTGGNSGGGRLQSEQCTECCRDHHDAVGTAPEAKYDPESIGVGKFSEANGILTAATTGNYAAACRVVKVDGLWRTTADMYQRHYGLLETTTVPDAFGNPVQAKSGIPSSTATSAYQTYVKDYLSQYTAASTTAPSGAQAMFDDTLRGLNLPALVTILTASAADYRYLHGRGLYVDYLGSKAQAAVDKCTGKTGTAYTECVLPALPFTTINLTEMANWTVSDGTILNINTAKALNFNVTEPSGGRTAGIKVGVASNNSSMRRSNSGVAVSDDILLGVDTNGDGDTYTDSQRFEVGGSTSTGSRLIWLQLLNHTIPAIDTSFSVLLAGEGCTAPVGTTGYRSCQTDASLPATGSLTISNYNFVTPSAPKPFASRSCTFPKNAGTEIVNVEPFSTAVPTLYDHAVGAVSGDGQLQPAVGSGKAETTSVTNMTISENTQQTAITVTFSGPTLIEATMPADASGCIAKKDANKYFFVSAKWIEAWAN